MTVDTVRWGSPSVFDAGLPTIAYEDGQNPDDAHRLIRRHDSRRRSRWGRTGRRC